MEQGTRQEIEGAGVRDRRGSGGGGGGQGSRGSASSYLISLGEVLGEFLMPPLRCFFLGDSVDGCSSSTGNTGSS